VLLAAVESRACRERPYNVLFLCTGNFPKCC
jgi:hypothetical protein